MTHLGAAPSANASSVEHLWRRRILRRARALGARRLETRRFPIRTSGDTQPRAPSGRRPGNGRPTNTPSLRNPSSCSEPAFPSFPWKSVIHVHRRITLQPKRSCRCKGVPAKKSGALADAKGSGSGCAAWMTLWRIFSGRRGKTKQRIVRPGDLVEASSSPRLWQGVVSSVAPIDGAGHAATSKQQATSRGLFGNTA